MKIAAVVILYNPGPETPGHLQTYLPGVPAVYVVDNTPEPGPVSRRIAALNTTVYLSDGENHGLAKALNLAANRAIADGYEWLLTMDQDSFFPEGSFSWYLQAAEASGLAESAAMFGTRYGRADLPSSATAEIAGTDALITSGSLLNLLLFQRIGAFDEQLFIDSVDHEYCVRALLGGYRILQVNNIYLRHEIGEEVRRSSIKSLFLVRRTKVLHTPLRCYYMYRNYLYLRDKYQQLDPAFVKLLREYVLTYLKNFLLYGTQTLLLLRYVRKAVRDYRAKKMGRIDHMLK